MNKLRGWILAFLLLAGVHAAYITVPNSFAAKQLISSSKMNANFAAFEDGLDSGTKDANLYRLYIQNTKVIDYNRNITCSDLTVTGDLSVTGDFKVTGDMTIVGTLTISDEGLTLVTLNADEVTGDAVVTTTNGSVDANKIARLNSVGKLDDDLMAYDIYNFYVKYPYAASVTTETIQEQMFYANGTITTCKAELGTDATGAAFIVNVLNEGVTADATGENYTFKDVDGTVSVNTRISTTVTANNVLQLQVEQVGSTLAGQDLRVQVYVKRRD